MTAPMDQQPLAVLRGFHDHDWSLAGFLATRVARVPAKEALVFEGRRWSYLELEQDILRARAWLRARGVRPGDRVGVLSANHPSTVILMFALASLGAIMVPANPAYTAAEARYVFQHAGISGLVVSPETLTVARQAAVETGTTPWLVLNEPATDDTAPVFADLLRQQTLDAGFADTGANADATALIIYTSGTTGFPKGVQHGQRGIVITGESFVGRLHLQNEDRVLCVMPLFHINALMYSLCGAIAAGATVVLARRFSASSFWRTVGEERVTEVNLVPAVANILLDRPRTEYVPGHALTKIFVAPATERLIKALEAEFAVEHVIECYGMSEIPGLFANPFEGPRKVASMGRLSPHPDPAIARPLVKVVDENGDPVEGDRVGQLLVKTPTMMQGYYNAPDLTQAAVRDGWFETGDLVWRDADGFYFYAGRLKDMIRRRGENISGLELDRELARHPDLVEVAAIAVPSPLGEDEILIVAVAREGSGLDERALGSWACARLSATKQPRYVVFVPSLPHTPTQRVEKYKLRRDASLMARAVDLQSAPPSDPRGGEHGRQ
jgi:crotonobetaine/carnitine-CoA ligase